MSLRDNELTIRTIDVGRGKYFGWKDIKDALSDWKLRVYIYNTRYNNMGKKDSQDITDKVKYLEDKYGLHYADVDWDVIFGDFEK